MNPSLSRDYAYYKVNETRLSDHDVIQSVHKEIFAKVDNDLPQSLVLDLNNVEFLVSLFLGKLMLLYKHISGKGGELVLTNVNEQITHVLEMTNLTKLIKIN